MARININKALLTVQDLASKNQTGGYLSPDEYNNFAALVQDEIINEVFQLLDFNRTSTNILSDVVKVKPVSVVNGHLESPDDLKQLITAYAKYYDDKNKRWIYREVETLNQTELGSRLNSQIEIPDNDYPVIVKNTEGYKIYPSGISYVELVYVYDYPQPEYVTTGTPPVYDPVNSVDFMISDMFFDLVVYRLCMAFGISVKDANLQQASVKNIIK